MKRFAWLCAAVMLLMGACSEENKDAFGPVVKAGIDFATEGLPSGKDFSYRVLIFNGVSLERVGDHTLSDLSSLSQVELPAGRYVWTVIAGYDQQAMTLLETENLSTCRLFLNTEATIPALYYASRLVYVGEEKQVDLLFSPILSSIEVSGQIPGEASSVEAVCAGIPRNFNLSSRSWMNRY